VYLVSGCASLDDVVNAFRRHASLGTLFVPTPTPIRTMTRRRFALALRDGGIVIEGEGEVITETGSGMTIRFFDLDTDSAAMLSHLERVRFAARVPDMPPHLTVRVGPSDLVPPIGDDMAVCAVIGRLPAPPPSDELPTDVDLSIGDVVDGTDTVQMFSNLIPPVPARDTLMDGRLLEAVGREEPRVADQIDRPLDPPGAVILSPSIQIDALPRSKRPSRLPGLPPEIAPAAAIATPTEPSPPPVVPTAQGSSPLPRDLRQVPTDRIRSKAVVGEETMLVRPAPPRRSPLAIGAGVAAAGVATIVALAIGGDDDARPSTPPSQKITTTMVEPPPVVAGTARVDAGTQQAPATCRASIATTPAGADLFIGKKKIGTSPVKIELPCAPVTVVVRRPRYLPATANFEPTPDGASIDIALARPSFSVRVTSTPSGATITVNGSRAGRTPATVRVPGYEPLVIEARKKGYAPESRRVFVKRKTGTTVKLTLDRR
jgi:hypothetical protein